MKFSREGVNDMVIMNSADAIKNWSEATETVIKGKPIFIEDESNKMILSNLEFVELLLSGYTYSAKKHIENEKYYTISQRNRFGGKRIY